MTKNAVTCTDSSINAYGAAFTEFKIMIVFAFNGVFAFFTENGVSSLIVSYTSI